MSGYWTEGGWIIDLLEKEKNDMSYFLDYLEPTEENESKTMNYSAQYGNWSSWDDNPFKGRLFLITTNEYDTIENGAEILRRAGKEEVESHGKDEGGNFRQMGFLLSFAKMIRDQSHSRAKEILAKMSPEVQGLVPERILTFLATEGETATIPSSYDVVIDLTKDDDAEATTYMAPTTSRPRPMYEAPWLSKDETVGELVVREPDKIRIDAVPAEGTGGRLGGTVYVDNIDPVFSKN